MENLLNKDGSLTYDINFLNKEEAQNLFNILYEKVNWEQKLITIYEKTIPIPRLTAWFGDNDVDYAYSGIVNKTQTWIPELMALKLKVEEHLGVKFNSCLLNLYRNGKDQVSWHADNERELGSEPLIASISLGETRSFQVKHRYEKNNKLSLMVTSGSLVLMSGKMQQHWLHRLAPTEKEVGPRINITFRIINP